VLLGFPSYSVECSCGNDMSDSDDPAARARIQPPRWAFIPVVLSAVGFLGGALLYPLNYEEDGVWDDIFFALFSLGWIS